MCFENTVLCSDVRDAWDIALGKAFYLCLQILHHPRSPPSYSSPSPFLEGTKPQHRQLLGLPCLLYSVQQPPLNASFLFNLF